MADETQQYRYREAKRLLLGALDLPEQERETWLRQQTGSDTAMLQEVLELLGSHADAEESGSLEESVFERPARRALQVSDGSVIDAWTIEEKIGSGGMGVVYRARRSDGAFDRIVALKLIRSDMDTTRIAAKFDAERKTLARLDHPNIARLYDGGLSDAGSYIVMELVNGDTITTYCEAKALGQRDKILLFLQVCNAVGFAHRNLVVHRDLKPSNILVNEDGAVKLLDFGIATLLDQEDVESRIRTSSAMTPAYAAPEQVSNQSVTTSTDTYSLGVLLYEMLTGARPYDLTGKTASQIERTICEEVPTPPSAVAGKHGASEKISSDLDTIIAKALAKDPAMRYTTAEALADDLNRFLRGDPVQARPPTAGYRLRKFIGRNRTGVVAAAVVSMALLLGMTFSLWQARIAAAERDLAETRFDLAREVTSTLLFDIHDSVSNLTGSTPAREMIIARSLNYLEELDKTASGHTQLKIDIARAYRRIGDVLGNPSNDNLGKVSEAINSYEKGLQVMAAVGEADSLAFEASLAKALLHEKLGDVLAHTGELDSALEHLETSVGLFSRALDSEPENVNRILAVAIGRIKQADYTGNRHFPNAGKPDQAHLLYEESLSHISLADSLDPGNERVQRYLGLIYERFGTVEEQLGEISESRESYQKSLEYRERLWANDPGNMVLYRDAGIGHEKVGLSFQQEGRLQDALTELQTAHSYYTDIAKSDPTNVNARVTLAVSEMQMAELMHSEVLPHFGESAAALRHYQTAAEILLGVIEIDSTNVRIQSLLDEVRAGESRLLRQ